ncbi:hypothetical protein BT63DRAFT_280266 [Microthyrium microscopicum]|uniref:Uncharacterized protein n=1 Tax=Microthyrium microscopicum TaxID=703497 RepID=A0A6A6UCB1_9PEZI|nr:hypothetical protein BT63DRAFT_280266 [Microthyrium microscopicum]
MGRIYDHLERGVSNSMQVVCCLPTQHAPAAEKFGMRSESTYSGIVYQEPLSDGSQMAFERLGPPVTTISSGTPRLDSTRRRTSLFSRPRTAGSLSAMSRPWTSSGMKSRPRISAPMDFRRVSDPQFGVPMPRRRQFRPLELSIYEPSGRLSPLPDFGSDAWEEMPTMPKAAVVRDWDIIAAEQARNNPLRSNPVTSSYVDLANRFSSASDGFASNGPGPAVHNDDIHMSATALPYFDDDMPTSPPMTDAPAVLRRQTSSGSRPKTATSATKRSRSPIEPTLNHSRSISDMVRPLKSSGSIRRRQTSEVDEEIRELNTIVEERRVSALTRAQSDQTTLPTRQHIPAIAPAMNIRARSQTLSDIGSAFSVPYANTSSQPYPPLASPPVALTTNTRPSRLRSWLTTRSNSVRSTNTTASLLSPKNAAPQAFYSVQPVPGATYSETSSPTLSDFSDDSSARAYALTPTTQLSTPQSFSPIRDLATPNSLTARDWSPPGSLRKSNSAARRMRAVRPVVAPKRGLSIESTMTTDSVGTSILGGKNDGVIMPPAAVGVAF